MIWVGPRVAADPPARPHPVQPPGHFPVIREEEVTVLAWVLSTSERNSRLHFLLLAAFGQRVSEVRGFCLFVCRVSQ